MPVLLDTHIFIWFINGDNRLSTRFIEIIRNTENTCYISIASIWEIAIKISLGKLDITSEFENIKQFLVANEIAVLPLTFEHLNQLRQLEFHHRDPFDRVIIAQSFVEQIPIMTKDEVFKKYHVQLV